MATEAPPARAATSGLNGSSRNAVRGVAAWTVAAVVFVWAHDVDPQFSLFWGFGLAFGFVLQRGRICFASAFRDLFLLGHGRTMKGVLCGLAVASVGFGIVMSRQVPLTNMGIFPPSADVLPVGIHTALGGVLFGVGMVLAGGCVSGSIYRMGEGYVGSWVAFAGIMGGLLVSAFTWNWWWRTSISTGPRIWLPRSLGHAGALLVTLIALGAAFVWVLRIEHKAGMVVPAPRRPEDASESVADDLRAAGRTVFVRGWPILIAGAVLGGLNALLFAAQEPWGITGEIGRLTAGLATVAGAGPPPPEGAGVLPGCTLRPWNGAISHMTFLLVGMWLGSLAGALGAGEFKLRIPRRPVRYVQSLGGGVLMGYGAGIAMGCTIGAFFSGIPSLAINGWVFGAFLGVGAWIGTQMIRRIA